MSIETTRDAVGNIIEIEGSDVKLECVSSREQLDEWCLTISGRIFLLEAKPDGLRADRAWLHIRHIDDSPLPHQGAEGER